MFDRVSRENPRYNFLTLPYSDTDHDTGPLCRLLPAMAVNYNRLSAGAEECIYCFASAQLGREFMPVVRIQ